MTVVAWIKATLEALIALPKILSEINEGIKQIRIEALNKAHNDALKELKEAVEQVKKAKTNAEIDNALDAIKRK